MIEIDAAEVVYSTRRGGAPVTSLKRLLLRLLRQYLVELEARQTRFNIALLARLRALEERVERLEAKRDGRVSSVHQVLSSAGPYDAVSAQVAAVARAAHRARATAARDYAALDRPARARVTSSRWSGCAPEPATCS